MPVDTGEMRGQAISERRDPYGSINAANLLDEAADEIDSLRKQLAEAQANAITWHDGPARGGEIPDASQFPLDQSFIFIVWNKHGYLPVEISRFKTIAGKQWGIDPEYILAWCLESDLLPKESNP